MAKTIKVGVITEAGGAHLSAYFDSLKQTDEAEAVALADPSGRSEAMARKTLGPKLKEVFKDPAVMLKTFAPQMAMVSMEAASAPAAIDAALEAGCHVFAEKPSCIRAVDFEKLARKAQRKHRHLMLALANRVHAPVQQARKFVSEGKLGKVFGIEIHIMADQTRLRRPTYPKTWFASKSRAGGGFMTWLGIHWLDLALYISGLKIQKVSGFAGVVGGTPIEVEDAGAMSMAFDNGSFGTMMAGYFLDKGYHSHIQFWGENGWLKLGALATQPLEWYTTKGVKTPKIETHPPMKGRTGYQPFVRACIRASAGLEDPPITAEEGLHVLRSIFTFYDAARGGKTLPVS